MTFERNVLVENLVFETELLPEMSPTRDIF